MESLWWNLPGPEEFVHYVAQSLREGRSAVLCLPQYLPGGLRTSIQEAFRDSYEIPWRVLSLSDEQDYHPLDCLYSKFGSEAKEGRLDSVTNLVQDDGFAGKLIWIEDVTAESWPDWKQFLMEYEQVCRNVSLLERTVFCVLLTGQLALEPPPEEVTLSVHKWEGVVQDLDTLIFTTKCFKSSGLPPLRMQLAITLTTALALWDPWICLRFSGEPEARIFDPMEVIIDIASERGWNADGQEPSGDQWHKGMLNTYMGKRQHHSAWLAVTGNRREINHRILGAQMAVMLPYVEQKRQLLLDRLSSILRVPFRTRSGELIDDLYDLEINHIESQVSTYGRAISPEVRKFVSLLKRIRNSLSHLEPLSLDLILCRELEGLPWQND